MSGDKKRRAIPHLDDERTIDSMKVWDFPDVDGSYDGIKYLISTLRVGNETDKEVLDGLINLPVYKTAPWNVQVGVETYLGLVEGKDSNGVLTVDDVQKSRSLGRLDRSPKKSGERDGEDYDRLTGKKRKRRRLSEDFKYRHLLDNQNAAAPLREEP